MPAKRSYKMNWHALLQANRLRPSQSQVVSDLRNEFEKDYHRIISSASFRRLQDKTQVFPLDQSDFIRTRLTHSLEVSSLAKSLGQATAQEIYFRQVDPTFEHYMSYELGDLLLCAGLIHDIGNPPFGHYGETTIREWFMKHLPTLTFDGRRLTDCLSDQMIADLIHFEGNAQALRLLTKLHFIKDEFGMNLTLPLLNTIIKYPVSSLKVNSKDPDIRYHKIGYFYSEQDLYQKIIASTGAVNCRHPVTYLLEAADDIAYRTADIEDAYIKGRLTYQDLKTALLDQANSSDITADQREHYLYYVNELDIKRQDGLDKGVGKVDLYAIQNWAIFIQGALIKLTASAFCDHYEAIMNGEHPNDLFKNTVAELIMNALGSVAYQYVFTSKPIISLEIAANKMIGGLLDLFIPACIHWQTDHQQLSLEPRLMAIISDNYRKNYLHQAESKSPEKQLYLRILLVTDYICGMTDSFAKSLHQKMNGY